jgi:hypothetical protein
MLKRLIPFLALALLLGVSAAHAETFGAVLTGGQENPPTGSAGIGTATVTLDSAHTSITVVMFISGLTAAVSDAHIHEGVAGTNGPVRIGLTPGTNLVNGRMNVTLPIDKSRGDDIAANPGKYYLNVHTSTFPGGEIRGQLTANDDITKFVADLRGSNEVPPNNSTVVGTALITIDSANNLTFDVSTPGIVNPTNAHIHGPNGAAGTNAGVFIGLFSQSNPFNNGRLRGVIPNADAAQIAQLKANPSNFYVNVHTAAIPGGELRGQLVAANEADIAVAGKVAGALGTNFVTDVRIFNPSSTRASALLEYFQTGLAANSNAAASLAVDIAPRGTAVLDDVNGASFLNMSGTGGIRVTSATPIIVTSRIYNDQRAAGHGTFGQFVPGTTRAIQWRRGVLTQLANRAITANPEGSRTNIGFFNPNAATVNVRLELRGPDGALLGTGAVDLAALSQQQGAITAYFPGVDLENRAALTVTFDASAPVIGYASVVDNISGDQIFVTAQQDIAP